MNTINQSEQTKYERLVSRIEGYILRIKAEKVPREKLDTVYILEKILESWNYQHYYY